MEMWADQWLARGATSIPVDFVGAIEGRRVYRDPMTLGPVSRPADSE